MDGLASISKRLEDGPPWLVPVIAGGAIGGVFLLLRKRNAPETTAAAPVSSTTAASDTSGASSTYEGQYIDQSAVLASAGANTQAEIAKLQAALDARLQTVTDDNTRSFGTIGSGISEITGKQTANDTAIAALTTQIAALQAQLNKPAVQPVVTPTQPTTNTPAGTPAGLTADDWRMMARNGGQGLQWMQDAQRRFEAGTKIQPSGKAVLYLPVAYNSQHDTWRGSNNGGQETTLFRAVRKAADTMAGNPAQNSQDVFRQAIIFVGNEVKQSTGSLWAGGFDFWSLGMQG